MRPPKFSFVPERQLGEKGMDGIPYKVSIHKNGVLSFGRETIDVYGLEGKHIKLFADIQKKAVGWKIIEGNTNLEELAKSRVIKKNKIGGNATIGIGSIMKALGIKEGVSRTNLQVQKYETPLEEKPIWYVIINDEIK